METVWKRLRQVLSSWNQAPVAFRDRDDLRGLPEHTLHDIGLEQSDIPALEMERRSKRMPGCWWSWG